MVLSAVRTRQYSLQVPAGIALEPANRTSAVTGTRAPVLCNVDNDVARISAYDVFDRTVTTWLMVLVVFAVSVTNSST